MTGCRDAEAPYCQCAACAGSCCCRAEHLVLPCPVAGCPDYVPKGRDDFVPVLTSRQLAERQAAQAAITPPAQQTTLAEIRARLAEARAGMARGRAAPAMRHWAPWPRKRRRDGVF